MPNPLITLENVAIALQSKQILINISLDVMQDRHYAIIGRSGSGKGTLLKVLAGLQGISGGHIAFNFNDTPTDRPPLHKVVLLDSRHHFKNKSNTTDLYYQQRFNSFDSEDSPTVAGYLSEIAVHAQQGYWTIEKVIERLAIQAILDKEIIKLSNGEAKRLRLASALIKNPKLLLLNQPLTGLDVAARQSFDDLLKDVAKHGCTIIMTTSPKEIPLIIDEIIWIGRGQIENVIDGKDFRQEEFEWEKVADEIDKKEISALLVTSKTTYNTFIKMADVNVRYGDKQILKDINWEVKQGERWALLGHNGAGKSTLLSLIYGDNPQAYANNIVLFNKKRGTGESIWDIKKRCGFVSPELFQYFPTDNSGLQVVESGFYDTLGLFRQSEVSRAALALRWMKVFGIDPYAKQPLKNIPANAQRLCLLARALVKNPDLLILDEPCQGLDEHQKNLFKTIIDTICRQSDLTLIYVTHYIEELPDAVNKTLRLQNGAMVY